MRAERRKEPIFLYSTHPSTFLYNPLKNVLPGIIEFIDLEDVNRPGDRLDNEERW